MMKTENKISQRPGCAINDSDCYTYSPRRDKRKPSPRKKRGKISTIRDGAPDFTPEINGRVKPISSDSPIKIQTITIKKKIKKESRYDLMSCSSSCTDTDNGHDLKQGPNKCADTSISSLSDWGAVGLSSRKKTQTLRILSDISDIPSVEIPSNNSDRRSSSLLTTASRNIEDSWEKIITSSSTNTPVTSCSEDRPRRKIFKLVPDEINKNNRVTDIRDKPSAYPLPLESAERHDSTSGLEFENQKKNGNDERIFKEQASKSRSGSVTSAELERILKEQKSRSGSVSSAELERILKEQKSRSRSVSSAESERILKEQAPESMIGPDISVELTGTNWDESSTEKSESLSQTEVFASRDQNKYSNDAACNVSNIESSSGPISYPPTINRISSSGSLPTHLVKDVPDSGSAPTHLEKDLWNPKRLSARAVIIAKEQEQILCAAGGNSTQFERNPKNIQSDRTIHNNTPIAARGKMESPYSRKEVERFSRISIDEKMKKITSTHNDDSICSSRSTQSKFRKSEKSKKKNESSESTNQRHKIHDTSSCDFSAASRVSSRGSGLRSNDKQRKKNKEVHEVIPLNHDEHSVTNSVHSRGSHSKSVSSLSYRKNKTFIPSIHNSMSLVLNLSITQSVSMISDAMSKVFDGDDEKLQSKMDKVFLDDEKVNGNQVSFKNSLQTQQSQPQVGAELNTENPFDDEFNTDNPFGDTAGVTKENEVNELKKKNSSRAKIDLSNGNDFTQLAPSILLPPSAISSTLSPMPHSPASLSSIANAIGTIRKKKSIEISPRKHVSTGSFSSTNSRRSKCSSKASGMSSSTKNMKRQHKGSCDMDDCSVQSSSSKTSNRSNKSVSIPSSFNGAHMRQSNYNNDVASNASRISESNRYSTRTNSLKELDCDLSTNGGNLSTSYLLTPNASITSQNSRKSTELYSSKALNCKPITNGGSSLSSSASSRKEPAASKTSRSTKGSSELHLRSSASTNDSLTTKTLRASIGSKFSAESNASVSSKCKSITNDGNANSSVSSSKSNPAPTENIILGPVPSGSNRNLLREKSNRSSKPTMNLSIPPSTENQLYFEKRNNEVKDETNRPNALKNFQPKCSSWANLESDKICSLHNSKLASSLVIPSSKNPMAGMFLDQNQEHNNDIVTSDVESIRYDSIESGSSRDSKEDSYDLMYKTLQMKIAQVQTNINDSHKKLAEVSDQEMVNELSLYSAQSCEISTTSQSEETLKDKVRKREPSKKEKKYRRVKSYTMVALGDSSFEDAVQIEESREISVHSSEEISQHAAFPWQKSFQKSFQSGNLPCENRVKIGKLRQLSSCTTDSSVQDRRPPWLNNESNYWLSTSDSNWTSDQGSKSGKSVRSGHSKRSAKSENTSSTSRLSKLHGKNDVQKEQSQGKNAIRNEQHSRDWSRISQSSNSLKHIPEDSFSSIDFKRSPSNQSFASSIAESINGSMTGSRLFHVYNQNERHMKVLKKEERFIAELNSAHALDLNKGKPYTCYICLETHMPPTSRKITESTIAYNPYQLSECGHMFCQSCIAPYLCSKIDEGDVYPTCFFPIENVVNSSTTTSAKYTPCGCKISKSDITEILCENVKTLEKYKRLKFDKDHPFSRRCPDCNVPNLFETKSIVKNNKQICIPCNPVTNCMKCEKEFCFYHSCAHVGMTCAEYEKDTTEDNDLNTEFINTFAKKCPKCSMLVQKLDGCNQMKCPMCDTNFCWLCLKIVDDGTFPAHFQWWNLAGCPNMQLNESIQPSKTELILSRGMSIVQIIVVGIPSGILATATFIPLYCVFHSIGTSFKDRALNFFSLWGNVLTVLMLIPLALAAIALSPVLFLMYGIFGLFYSEEENYDLGISYSSSSDEENQ